MVTALIASLSPVPKAQKLLELEPKPQDKLKKWTQAMGTTHKSLLVRTK